MTILGESEPVEHSLAKALAANELEPRMAALESTKTYLKENSESEQVKMEPLEDMLKNNAETADNLEKIWKGLFYCMWHSDKLAVQDELCDKYSNILHGMDPKNPGYQLLYVRAFFRTMSREWNGVDQYRINKYMRLVRFVLRQSLVCFTKNGELDSLFSVLTEEGLGPIDWKTGNINNVPLGLKYHFVDIWIEEWKNLKFGLDIMNETDFIEFDWKPESFNSRFIDDESTWQMMRPWVIVILRTKLDFYRNRVYDDIFEILLEEADCSVDMIKSAPGLDEDEVKSMVNTPRLQLKFEFLANRIMSCCNGKVEIDAPLKQTNRNRAYKLINRLREVAMDHVPIPEGTPDLSVYDKLKKKNKLDRRQRKKENQRFRKRMASDQPLEEKSAKKKKIVKCDDLLEEKMDVEADSGVSQSDDDDEMGEVGVRSSKSIMEAEEVVLDTSKRDGNRKRKNKKKNAKRLEMLRGAISAEEDRLEEAESKKALVNAVNKKHDNDDSEDKRSGKRLNIRLDKCQVKYFDKKEKLKYETSDAYDPDNTPTRSILSKVPIKK